MCEVVPRISVFAVILPHRPPLPFTQVRAPFLPWSAILRCFLKAGLFDCHDLGSSDDVILILWAVAEEIVLAFSCDSEDWFDNRVPAIIVDNVARVVNETYSSNGGKRDLSLWMRPLL